MDAKRTKDIAEDFIERAIVVELQRWTSNTQGVETLRYSVLRETGYEGLTFERSLGKLLGRGVVKRVKREGYYYKLIKVPPASEMIDQLVLNVLYELDEPSTSLKVGRYLQDSHHVFVTYKTVAGSMTRLHHGGFLHKHIQPGVRKAAKWSLV